MTEAEWLACIDPQKMLRFLRGKVSERKLRLFAVACCRLLAPGKNGGFRVAVEEAERHADGRMTKAALKRARQAVRAARYELLDHGMEMRGEWSVCWLAEVAASENAYAAVGDELIRLSEEGILELSSAKRSSLCSNLHCIFGNPFRPISLDPFIPTWNDSTVTRLAQSAYDERLMPAGTLDNGRLAVLADALEEAGCTDFDILGHCRSGGEHVRGCWVVDLVLGKS